MQETVTPEMVRNIRMRTKEPKAILLKLEAEQIDTLYITNWPGGIVSRGQEYVYFPFTFKWPGASQDEPSRRAQVQIMNTDRRLAEAIRVATGEPKLTAELIRVATPDVVEMVMSDAKLSQAEVDAPNVSGDLDPKSFRTEPACSARYTYARTPGLF